MVQPKSSDGTFMLQPKWLCASLIPGLCRRLLQRPNQKSICALVLAIVNEAQTA